MQQLPPTQDQAAHIRWRSPATSSALQTPHYWDLILFCRTKASASLKQTNCSDAAVAVAVTS